jgi:hypothetical protein
MGKRCAELVGDDGDEFVSQGLILMKFSPKEKTDEKNNNYD